MFRCPFSVVCGVVGRNKQTSWSDIGTTTAWNTSASSCCTLQIIRPRNQRSWYLLHCSRGLEDFGRGVEADWTPLLPDLHPMVFRHYVILGLLDIAGYGKYDIGAHGIEKHCSPKTWRYRRNIDHPKGFSRRSPIFPALSLGFPIPAMWGNYPWAYSPRIL